MPPTPTLRRAGRIIISKDTFFVFNPFNTAASLLFNKKKKKKNQLIEYLRDVRKTYLHINVYGNEIVRIINVRIHHTYNTDDYREDERERERENDRDTSVDSCSCILLRV